MNRIYTIAVVAGLTLTPLVYYKGKEQIEKYETEQRGYYKLSLTPEKSYSNFYKELIAIPDDKPIHLSIETNGGEGVTTYKICRRISKRRNPVKAIVTEGAYSAGTIIALSCHSLEMGPDASLSAIDPQVEYPPKQTRLVRAGELMDGDTKKFREQCAKADEEFSLMVKSYIHHNHDLEKVMKKMYEDVAHHETIFFPEQLRECGVRFKYIEK